MLLIPTVATVGLGLRETTAKLSQHGPTLIAEKCRTTLRLLRL